MSLTNKSRNLAIAFMILSMLFLGCTTQSTQTYTQCDHGEAYIYCNSGYPIIVRNPGSNPTPFEKEINSINDLYGPDFIAAFGGNFSDSYFYGDEEYLIRCIERGEKCYIRNNGPSCS